MELLLTIIASLGAVLVLLLVVAAFSAIGGLLFWLAWNYVVAAAFGGPELTFYQAWALWFLIGMVGRTFRAWVSSEKSK